MLLVEVMGKIFIDDVVEKVEGADFEIDEADTVYEAILVADLNAYTACGVV